MTFSGHYKTNHVCPGPKHRKRPRARDSPTTTLGPQQPRRQRAQEKAKRRGPAPTRSTLTRLPLRPSPPPRTPRLSAARRRTLLGARLLRNAPRPSSAQARRRVAHSGPRPLSGSPSPSVARRRIFRSAPSVSPLPPPPDTSPPPPSRPTTPTSLGVRAGPAPCPDAPPPPPYPAPPLGGCWRRPPPSLDPMARRRRQ